MFRSGSSICGAVTFLLAGALTGSALGQAHKSEPTVVIPRVAMDPVAAQIDSDRIQAERAVGGTKPVYGEDDRMDWGPLKSTSERIKARARASVALFTVSSLTKTTIGGFGFKGKSMQEARNLCKDERFASQYTASFCSGTLIADDLILTAGHCVNDIAKDRKAPNARDIMFVFGYYASDQRDPGRSTFDARDVYRGKEVIVGILKDVGGDDYAVVRLERKVPPSVAKPIPLIQRSRIQDNARVYVIGYPSGLPLKYAAGAWVTNNSARAYFSANLDTFGGNSGSGVFNEETGDLVGVLVRGDTDYYWDGPCQRAYRCPITGCGGEDVTRAEIIKLP